MPETYIKTETALLCEVLRNGFSRNFFGFENYEGMKEG